MTDFEPGIVSRTKLYILQLRGKKIKQDLGTGDI